ncbi:Cell pattern formation-associated protein stuA [Ceratocystis platani]|uniref:Cell pattern formation-associated protein stuA n=1 Tax=Ceratocystis fimbriata f. sp. platani TaxID=88771 RepID=A0A0F8AWI7_CERFI|nr:Cell pattern formation-associated protein stuA [Ceratocystis platani]
MDTTGQIAPPGMKPRVTATLWEDEGSVCFQVEAKGICVARREDDNMINGTKLLNVAGMTRGRRDGILKSEKQRRVVKIGPMHLKGVWIPYERALDFANKEKITELLYPLFVHQISTLLCHPANSTRTNQVLAAHERPTTPPGGAMGPMQAYSQTPSGQHYDSRPPMYNAASSQQSPYQNSAPMPQERVYQSSYVKTEMAPPASRSGSIVEVEQQEKAGAGIMPSDQSNQVVPHGEPEPEADHENEYTHDSTYDNRNAPQYNYPAPTPVAPMPETQIPSDTGSPSHGNNGRATPRTTNSHTFYQPPSTVSYPTSPRNMSSNNVFHVINNDRNNSGAATPDNETFPKIEMSKGYTPQPPVGNNNGGSAGIKRSLDDDEEAVPDIKRRKTELSADGNASSGYDSVSRPNGVAVPRRR